MSVPKEFFNDEDLGSYTFRDLINEKHLLLDAIKGNGPIARRARALVDMLPEVFRRYYIHQNSSKMIRIVVGVWSVSVLVIRTISGKTIKIVPDENLTTEEIEAIEEDEKEDHDEDQPNDSDDEVPTSDIRNDKVLHKKNATL